MPRKVRVTVGSNDDPATYSEFNVNDDSHPTILENEHFICHLVVRIKGFAGNPTNPNTTTTTSTEPTTTPYFSTTNWYYSIQLQGRFKRPFNGDDVVFGIAMDRPIKHLPPGVDLAVSVAKRIDPGLFIDLRSSNPYSLSPILTAIPVFAMTKAPVSEVGILPSWRYGGNAKLQESTPFRKPSTTTPLTGPERQKHFLSKPHRDTFIFDPEFVYEWDFGNQYFDVATTHLRLPLGISINLAKYWDGQPISYTARTRDGSAVFFGVAFELVDV